MPRFLPLSRSSKRRLQLEALERRDVPSAGGLWSLLEGVTAPLTVSVSGVPLLGQEATEEETPGDAALVSLALPLVRLSLDLPLLEVTQTTASQDGPADLLAPVVAPVLDGVEGLLGSTGGTPQDVLAPVLEPIEGLLPLVSSPTEGVLETVLPGPVAAPVLPGTLPVPLLELVPPLPAPPVPGISAVQALLPHLRVEEPFPEGGTIAPAIHSSPVPVAQVPEAGNTLPLHDLVPPLPPLTVPAEPLGANAEGTLLGAPLQRLPELSPDPMSWGRGEEMVWDHAGSPAALAHETAPPAAAVEPLAEVVLEDRAIALLPRAFGLLSDFIPLRLSLEGGIEDSLDHLARLARQNESSLYWLAVSLAAAAAAAEAAVRRYQVPRADAVPQDETVGPALV